MVEQGAALAGGGKRSLPRSSGAGLRPGTLGCPARSSLTAWTLREVLVESADRTPSNAVMERREAPYTPVGCTHLLKGCAAWRSISLG